MADGLQGVSCVGYTDLPSRLPAQSSTLYSNNISKFLLSMGPFTGHKNTFLLDHNDPAVRGALVLDKGKMMWPPPPPPVSSCLLVLLYKLGSQNASAALSYLWAVDKSRVLCMGWVGMCRDASTLQACMLDRTSLGVQACGAVLAAWPTA